MHNSPPSIPIRVAVIGLGGFAQTHHRALLELEREGLCRLVAACDPQPDAFADVRAQWAFDTRGVAVYDHYLTLLDAHASALDLVTLPVPIPLHAEMHRACVERHVAVYLEKPPTLDPEEFDAMLEVERRACRATAIGFHMMADPARLAVKERIARGEFGRVRRATFVGLWPRSSAYYRRNNWAGRLLMNGRMVLDSCAGNAMAHYLNNLCFWAGDEAARSWRAVERVEAELYRAHPIEGADTVFARGQFAGGAEMRLALTHACSGPTRQAEVVECERAVIEYVSPEEIHIRRTDGPDETLRPDPCPLVKESLRADVEYVAGRRETPCQRLAESAPFVGFHALLYVSARRIHTVQPPHAAVSRNAKGDVFVAIDRIQEAADALRVQGRLPSEAGFPWAAAGGGAAAASDIARLRETVNTLAAARAAESGFRAY